MHHYNLSLLFAEIANRHAGQPALNYPDKQYAYAELTPWVEGLAAHLRGSGIKRGDVIAIGSSKQAVSYALMLAALRLGIAYVNIDVASPLARNTRIMQMSGAKFLFYDDATIKSGMEALVADRSCTAELLEPDALRPISAQEREVQQGLMQAVDGACIAYVMFTSGSTGVPKGVAVTHQNVLHFIAWGQQCFGITPSDNFANLSPLYFDNSVFDFYVGLFSGASLTPVRRELLTAPYDLVSFVGQMKCTVWFSVPSMLIYLSAMKAMAPKFMPSLRHIVFGGEGYPKPELKKLYDQFSAQAHIVNVYGPTECTCICSAYRLGPDDFEEMTGLPPLGKLNPNFDYRILDENDQDGLEGELCLIGPNVAAGYFNDLERSAASFITLTDPGRFMKRMYRTGDIVREVAGQLHFVGRKDNQIKHMGYRIELEEIEHALVKLAGVTQAAVLYERTRAAYGKLIGFVAASTALDEKHLLVELAKAVPEYMLPSKIIVIGNLPKNPNGKVDRHQLRELL